MSLTVLSSKYTVLEKKSIPIVGYILNKIDRGMQYRQVVGGTRQAVGKIFASYQGFMFIIMADSLLPRILYSGAFSCLYQMLSSSTFWGLQRKEVHAANFAQWNGPLTQS